MTIGCIIQARLDSQRLCHKVLREMPPRSNRLVLGRCIEAAWKVERVDIVCVTSPDPAVLIIAKAILPYVKTHWWDLERDPLAEFHHAAWNFGMDAVIRITADCPMITSEAIDMAVSEFLDSGADYGYNNTDGADVEVFSFAVLDEAVKKASPEEHEHVTTWIRRNCRCVDLSGPKGEFLSLNTPEEYEKICRLLEERERGK